MSAPQFSPGPWGFYTTRSEPGAPHRFQITAPGQTVAYVYFTEATVPRHLADGHLLAAAPELYEALEWALAEITGRAKYSTPEQHQNCLSKAESVLAKARGEQP